MQFYHYSYTFANKSIEISVYLCNKIHGKHSSALYVALCERGKKYACVVSVIDTTTQLNVF